MTTATQQIATDETLRELIPPLTDDEREQLTRNIERDGCREPSSVWRRNGESVLLDGHNRLAICKERGIPFETTIVDGIDSIDSATLWVLRNQAGRRNLRTFQRVELELKAKDIIAGMAKEKQRESGGAVCQKSDKPVVHTLPTIAKRANTSHDTVHKVDRILQDADAGTVDKCRTGELSIDKAYRQVKHAERTTDRKQRERSALKHPSITGVAEARCSDWEVWYKSQEPCDLLLSDPPYSTDVEDITEFSVWLPYLLEKVKPTGRAYVFVGAYPEELGAYLRTPHHRHISLSQVLVWTYRNTLGPSPKDNYKLNWQAILYFVGVDAGPLNCANMVEQFSVQNINAPDGRIGDRYHTWQKPMDLAERFIRHGSSEGDIVLDPFCGTGTFLLAAKKLGRRGYGCDIDPAILEIAKTRGVSIEL